MKKYIKWGIITGLVVIVLGVGIGVGVAAFRGQNQYEGYWVYPSIEDCLTADVLIVECRIPEETLRRMSDEQLAQAVADFPLLIDIMAFSAPRQATEALAWKSDAYRELLTRRKGKEALIAKMKELQEKIPDSFVPELLKIVILDENSFRDTLTEKEMQILTGQ
uniref:hypothetical protein n=1 Tax=Acetatifactor sp. TaxID=1872090 RepID=UPI00405757AE